MIAGAISGNVTVSSVDSARRAGNLGGLLQGRVHVAQRRGREHVDVGRVIDAEDHDQPAHRIDVEAPVDADACQQRVQQARLGEARIAQATAATSGGTNSGSMLAAAMKPLHGVLVRTTIQEKPRPITTANAVPPPQAISELTSASVDVGIGEDGDEVRERHVEDAEPVHHRIGVGERAQQQHRDGVDDQEGRGSRAARRTRASGRPPANGRRAGSPRTIRSMARYLPERQRCLATDVSLQSPASLTCASFCTIFSC